MLTKVVGDRVYDFSHVVGGRNEVMGPVALALGEPGELFAVITRIDKNCNIARYSVGEYQDQEELLSTFGARGVGPGKMEWPSGIALDSDRNVYVTDAWTDSVSVFSNDGEYVRSFGSSGDGAGQFRRPSGIAIDADDNLLVVDTVNHRVQKLDRDGNPLTQWGRLGKAEGEFRSPWGVTIDGDGFIYVADHENHRVQKFDADGGFVFSLGSYGEGEGEFDHPSDVAIDPDGDIYVCDYANHRVQAFDAEGNYIHHLHRRRPGIVQVAEGIRPRQPGRVQGAPPRLYAGTGMALRRCRPPSPSTPTTRACWWRIRSAGASKSTTSSTITTSRSSTSKRCRYPLRFSAPSRLCVKIHPSETAMKYLKTIGFNSNQPIGRGFNYPYDTAFSADGRIFVLNRMGGLNARGIRIQICTFDEDWLGEFSTGPGDGDDQFRVPVCMAVRGGRQSVRYGRGAE